MKNSESRRDDTSNDPELSQSPRMLTEKNFFKLAERFRAATDAKQVQHLGDKLGRLVFGE